MGYTTTVEIEVDAIEVMRQYSPGHLFTILGGEPSDFLQVLKKFDKEELQDVASLCLELLSRHKECTFMEADFYRNLHDKLQNAR